MSESPSEAFAIRSALSELMSAVSDLARIVDSVSDGNADMPYVRSALEAAGWHIENLKAAKPERLAP